MKDGDFHCKHIKLLMYNKMINKEKIEQGVREVFEFVGEDPQRKGLIGTPDRVVRMYKEIFRGYDPKQRPTITTFQNGEDGLFYTDMVVDTGAFYSMCEHHMMPFFGQYYFAYIPEKNGKILGLSKIARVVDYCSARMQIQERLVTDIAEFVSEALGPGEHSIAIVLKGEHLCKSMRGVRKKGIMTSQHFTGKFKEYEQQKQFLDYVNSK